MSFTYDSLKQAIQDYTENSETTFVNNLSIFIRAAEERERIANEELKWSGYNAGNGQNISIDKVQNNENMDNQS